MLFVYLFALLTINTGEKKVTDEKEWRRKDKIMMMSEAFKMSYDVIAKSDKCKPLGEKGGGVEQMTESLCSNTLWKIIFIEAENKQSIGIRSGSVNLLAISEWKLFLHQIFFYRV